MPFIGQENDLDPLAAPSPVPKSTEAPIKASRQPFIGQENDLDPLAVKTPVQDSTVAEDIGRGAEDLGRSFSSGAVFDVADEFAAFMSYATGVGGKGKEGFFAKPFSQDYDELLDAERGRDEEIHPGAAIPGEIAGVIASTLAAAPLAGAALAGTKIAATAAKVPGWLKAAGFGAGGGAAYGFGGSEGGFEERAKGAVVGGAMGAATGAVAAPIMHYGGKVLGVLKESYANRMSPDKAARDKLAQAIERDEMSPTKVRNRLRELGPQATLADAGGKNVQSLARDVGGVPGPASNRAEQILNQRAEGEGARISTKIGQGLGRKEFYEAEEEFLANLKTRAAPIYKEAYDAHQSIMNPRLKRLMDSKYGKQALRKTADLVEAERASGQAAYLGKVDDELTDAMREASSLGLMENTGRPGVIKGFSLETWDQVKRGFDSVLDGKAYRNEVTGKLNKLGYAVDQMRRTLLRELDKETGGKASSLYAKARKIYGGDAEVLGGLRDGRKALTQDPESITRALAEMSDAAQDAYRTGAARALKDVIDKTGDTSSAAMRLFGNVRVRQRLKALFPDKETYKALAKTLIAEIRFNKTKNTVLGGSQTGPRLAGQADAFTRAGEVAGVAAASHMPGNTHPLLLAGMMKRMGGQIAGRQSTEYNKKLAQQLFSRNQSMNQQALDKLFDRVGAAGLDEATKQQLGRAFILSLAQQEARVAQSGQ